MACADPGIFVRGGPGQSDKKALATFFFSPQLILQKSNGYIQRKLSFFKVPEGVQHFPGGPTVSRGVQLLIPYRNPYNLWFSRGVRTPCPPPLFGSALACIFRVIYKDSSVPLHAHCCRCYLNRKNVIAASNMSTTTWISWKLYRLTFLCRQNRQR